MQMLILGNGFDLACGLPTSYNAFFDWRFNIIEKLYEEIEDLLGNYRSYFYVQFNPTNVVGNSYYDSLIESAISTNDGMKTFRSIYDELREIMNT